MTETFKELQPPAATGREILRLALDERDELSLSVDTLPFRHDVRLWGCALADLAYAAALHHTTVDTIVGATTNMALDGDIASSEFASNLQAILTQFSEDMLRGRSTPHEKLDFIRSMSQFPACLPESIALDKLARGDRFVASGDDLWMVTSDGPAFKSITAVNLGTGDEESFHQHALVRPVRRKAP